MKTDKIDPKRKMEANETKGFSKDQVKAWVREDLIKASMTMSMILGSENLLEHFAQEFYEKLKSQPVQEVTQALEEQRHIPKQQ